MASFSLRACSLQQAASAPRVARTRRPVRVLAYRESSQKESSQSQASQSRPGPPPVAHSRAALLASASSPTASVYKKPYTESEQKSLSMALDELAPLVEAGSVEKVQSNLLAWLEEAVRTRKPEPRLIEGAMAVLEQVYIMQEAEEDRVTGVLSGHEATYPGQFSPHGRLDRWQLVVGADVGSVQWIPVVEELQVSRDGATYTLDGDLSPMIGLFTGFSGESKWLGPGHLMYHTRRVRLELRRPEAWARGLKWLRMRSKQGAAPDAAAGSKPRAHAGEVEDALAVSKLCRPDPNSPALYIPLPFFPANELLIYSSTDYVACSRSKLGGLVLLQNKSRMPA